MTHGRGESCGSRTEKGESRAGPRAPPESCRRRHPSRVQSFTPSLITRSIRHTHQQTRTRLAQTSICRCMRVGSTCSALSRGAHTSQARAAGRPRLISPSRTAPGGCVRPPVRMHAETRTCASAQRHVGMATRLSSGEAAWHSAGCVDHPPSACSTRRYIVTRSSYIVTCTSYIVTRLSQHRVGAATCCHPQMQPRRTSHLPPSHSRQHRYRRTFMPPPWDKHSTQPPTAPRTGTVTPVPHSHSQRHAQLAAMPSQGSSYLSPLESGL